MAASAIRVSFAAPSINPAIEKAKAVHANVRRCPLNCIAPLKCKLSGTVAKGCDVLHSQLLHQGQENVGHWSPVWSLEMDVAFELASRVPGEEQRAALVIVHVGITHR